MRGPIAGKRIAKITISGMSDSMRADLSGRLPAHEGDLITPELMTSVMATAREFDEHTSVMFGRTQEGDVTLNISLPSAGVFRVGGGVASATPAGVAAEARPEVPKRITIGGNVQQAKLISQPKPVYPPEAKAACIQGVVHLGAIIGKDGSVIDLKVISGHPLFIPGAIDAVRQWVYQTTLLNGEPVEVQTQIDVNYTLSQ